MQKINDRLLVAVVSIAMVICFCPVTAFAAHTGQEDGSAIDAEWSITRVEWVGGLLSASCPASDSNAVVPEIQFTDLGKSDAGYVDMARALALGIVDVPNDGMIHPNNPATREFVAVTAARRLGIVLDENTPPVFDDKAETEFPTELQAAVDRGWFELSDGKVLPDQPITHDEYEKIVHDVAYLAVDPADEKSLTEGVSEAFDMTNGEPLAAESVVESEMIVPDSEHGTTEESAALGAQSDLTAQGSNSNATAKLNEIKGQTGFRPGACGWKSWNSPSSSYLSSCGPGCWCFAANVCSRMFGCWPSGTSGYRLTNPGEFNQVGQLVDTPTANPSYSGVQDLMKRAYPGDVIQFKGGPNGYGSFQHTAIVESVDSNGVTIYQHSEKAHVTSMYYPWSTFYNSYLDFDVMTSYNKGITLYHYKGYESKYPTGHIPEGFLDIATGGDGTVFVRGWAFDRDNPSASIDVHIYIGGDTSSGEGHAGIKANQDRPDVNKAYGISGKHGFQATINTNRRGSIPIYAFGINIGAPANNALLANVLTTTVNEPKKNAVSVPEGTYAIRTKLDTSMGLDVAGVSKEDKANVWLYKWNSGQSSGSSCQKFSIKTAGDGSYSVIATHSNKAVEVWGASTANSANISQYTLNGSACQKWFFDKNSDGTYTIRNRQSGLVMDVDGAKKTNNTNIMQYKSTGGDNQKFYLVPVDASRWDVSLSSTSMQHTGNALRPQATVKAGGVTMKEGTDYTLSYKNNVNVGTASVTVTAKGGYSGSKAATFKIASASSGQQNASSNASRTSMHRLYNPNSGEHFYTASDAERDHLVSVGWNSEGEGWTAPRESGTPVYRMYNANGGEHHYTMSEAERDMLVSVGWSYEGVGWYSDDQKRVPLYRDYNPNAFANNHNYTTSAAEHEMLMGVGWRSEGYAWYGM